MGDTIRVQARSYHAGIAALTGPMLVRAVFSHAWQLQAAGGWIVTITDGLHDGPLTVRIEENTLATLPARPGMQAYLFPETLFLGRIQITLAGACPWAPREDEDLAPVHLATLHHDLASLEACVPLSNMSPLAGDDLCSASLRARVQALGTALVRDDPGIQDATLSMLGLGPGLTPAGDDVLVGVLSGLRVLGSRCSGTWLALEKMSIRMPSDAREYAPGAFHVFGRGRAFVPARRRCAYQCASRCKREHRRLASQAAEALPRDLCLAWGMRLGLCHRDTWLHGICRLRSTGPAQMRGPYRISHPERGGLVGDPEGHPGGHPEPHMSRSDTTRDENLDGRRELAAMGVFSRQGTRTGHSRGHRASDDHARLLALWAEETGLALAGVIAEATPRRTTQLSCTLLHFAARGVAVQPLLDVLYTLGSGGAVMGVRELLAIGHSSGQDMLTGAYLAARAVVERGELGGSTLADTA